jgi:hypothetical protein
MFFSYALNTLGLHHLLAESVHNKTNI